MIFIYQEVWVIWKIVLDLYIEMKAKAIFVKSLTSYESLQGLNEHLAGIKERYFFSVKYNREENVSLTHFVHLLF